MVAESRRHHDRGRTRFRASTEPRLDGRGEVSRAAIARPLYRAASTEPRLDGRGGSDSSRCASRPPRLRRSRDSMVAESRNRRRRVAGLPWLQRSRDSMVAESQPRETGAQFSGASTEPRLDGRGELSGRRQPVLRASIASTEPRLDGRGEASARDRVLRGPS